MKVLYILDSLNRGGAEILALDVCRNAAASGLDLTFAALGGGALENDFANANFEFIRLKRRLPVDLLVVAQLRRIIKSKQIRIVHANQAVDGIHAYLACFGTRAKLVLSFHGFVGDAKNRRTLKFLIPRTAANIAVSRELLQWLAAAEKLDISRNFSVIANGVDAKRLVYSGENLRAELKLPAETLLGGMISNFYAAPRKDQLTVCRAFVAVAETLPNLELVFVGKIEAGAEYKFAECVKLCRENNLLKRVHFLGLREDVPKILDALNIFVLSSLHEGLPIAVLEAMALEIPCILSDIPPLLEVSGNGEFAEIFKTQDAADLAEKIIKLAENKNLRQDLARKTKIFAAENYSIEAHLGKLKTLYQKVLDN